MNNIRGILLSMVLVTSSFANDFNVEPLRTDEIGGTLGDIDSRMWAAPGMIYRGRLYTWEDYRDNDKVTWAHEGTHSINARIRFETQKPNGYYLLYGNSKFLTNPNLTLRQIAEAVPKDQRGVLYQNYLVNMTKYWNDTPLYVVDELTGYTNGAIVGVEYNLDRRAKESYSNAVEMYRYCDIAYDLCKEQQYEDLAKFKEVLDIIQKRLVILEKVLNSNK